MSIQPIILCNNSYFKNKKQGNLNSSVPKNLSQKTDSKYPPFASYYVSNISFTSAAKPAMTRNIYKEFMQEYQRIFGNISITKIVRETLKSGELLGRGREKEVFCFPKMPKYIIAHLYQKPPANSPIEENKSIELPKYNFGQPFATNKHDILIKKKINGIPNGVDNYVKFIGDIFKLGDATDEMAMNYLEKIRLFKNFPQQAYDDLIKKVQYLNDNGVIYVDAYNPNNILLDAESKKINIIDVSIKDDTLKNSRLRYPNCAQDKTSIYDVINVLLDSKFQYYFLNHMTPEQQKEAISISKDVINKCVLASKSSNLSRNDDFFIKTISHMDKKHKSANGSLQLKAYTEFKDMYKDELLKISET